MPRFIMKVDRDRDHYVEWSTIVDNACADGTRAEMLARLQADSPGSDNPPEERMRRADETGTSARFWSPPYEGSWDDPELMVEQRGMLPRSDLRAYLDAYLEGDHDAAFALLRPFEDDA